MKKICGIGRLAILHTSTGWDTSKPSVLTKHNIRAFFAKAIDRQALFVYNTKLKQFGAMIFEPEDTEAYHANVTRILFGDAPCQILAAGVMTVRSDEQQITIKLLGQSKHYGWAREEDIGIAILDLVNILTLSGYEATLKKLEPYNTREPLSSPYLIRISIAGK